MLTEKGAEGVRLTDVADRGRRTRLRERVTDSGETGRRTPEDSPDTLTKRRDVKKGAPGGARASKDCVKEQGRGGEIK